MGAASAQVGKLDTSRRSATMRPMDTYLEGPVTLAQLNTGVWARPDHAAVALGIDERTIRRRVRAGTFVRTTIAGRVYVRQAPVQPQAAPAPEPDRREEQVSTALALVVREQAGRLEQLTRELTLAQVEAARLEATTEHQRASVARLELELANERQRVAQVEEQLARARQVEEQLAQAREQAAREQARAERLEQLANAPWYAVRVRRQLRRELTTGAA